MIIVVRDTISNKKERTAPIGVKFVYIKKFLLTNDLERYIIISGNTSCNSEKITKIF